MRDQLANYKVPQVQDYVQLKAALRELRKTVRSWERKVDIVQVSAYDKVLIRCAFFLSTSCASTGNGATSVVSYVQHH